MKSCYFGRNIIVALGVSAEPIVRVLSILLCNWLSINIIYTFIVF